ANQPLINSLNTLNTLKNSNPKRIQDSKKSKLQSLQKDSKIQSKTISKIGISIIASVLLSQNLVAADIPKNALPAGGKFIHGSGNIIIKDGNTMNITGKNTNHVIAWGGGFNIGKDAEVNFNTSHGRQASFLNLDYTNKASQILGNLNGNGNNIYLVNPSGVLIGENASINANKFIASTSALSELELKQFKANGTTNGASFSPVFKPNKGNIVNLGTIKANNGITLIGDTIDIRGGKIENTDGGTDKNNSIYFVGDKIYIDADSVDLSSNNNVYATAFSEGYIQRQMRNFQKDNFAFGSFNQLITNESYAYNDNGNITDKSGQSNFKKVITLGNGTADEALSEWYWFANGVNMGSITKDNANEFRLVGDIDFSKQIGGQDRYIIDFSKNENDADRSFMYSGNYHDPNNDNNYNDNMSVGKDRTNSFQGIFDGGGHTLSNIDINTSFSDKDLNDLFSYAYVGIFGYTNAGTISNLEVDTLNIKANNNGKGSVYAGAIVGVASNSSFSNIVLNHVGSISATKNSEVGGFVGGALSSSFSNIVLSDIGSIVGTNYVGGFAGYDYTSSFKDISINAIKTIRGYGNSNHAQAGGFIGTTRNNNSKFSNIVLNNIGNIYGTSGAGGFIGKMWSSGTISYSNITLNNIGTIVSSRGAGGFLGESATSGRGTFQNIALNNIGTISGNGTGVGGFAGDSFYSTFQNITLNNIGTIRVNGWSLGNYVGGFIGNVSSSTFSNIIMNNIGNINITNPFYNHYIGGFVGNQAGSTSFSNIYLYFNPDATIVANGTNLANVSVGKFYGNINNSIAFNNVHIYYNANPDSSLANPIKDVDSSNSVFYNQTIDPTTPETNKINLYAYDDSSKGKEIFKQALEKQNNSGGAFETNKIVNIGDDSNPIYSFEQTTGSNITPPDSNTPNIDLGDVTLDSSDFDVSILQTIINDILNEKYALNIEDIDEDKLNSSNILETLAYLLGIDYSLLEKDYESLSPKEQESYQTLHSLKQSLDFYTEFNKGESDGLKSEFEGWFGKGGTSSDDLKNIYQTSLDKHSYISESLTQLRDYVNGEGSYNGNGLINQISSINNNLKALESLKQRIKAAQKYYQEALEAKLPYETLEGIYNEMVKIIDESYAKAQSLLNTLESEDKVYLTNLLREYSIKENSGFDDITGTFTFNGENLQANLDKTILAGLSDKPNLTPPTKEEVGDDPTKENNPDVPNNLQKIADLASKEAILILPAQEKQEAIVEDGKERGRLCIVSDNAKTNNPCMAITY
ncbi:hypothetical protein BA185_07980, partial [Helicobacter pullorum]